MIIVEIIFSLIVGMWMVSLIILPTNKLIKLNDKTEIDIEKNMKISEIQQSLYESMNIEIEEDFKKINEQIYDTSSKDHKKVSEDKSYINIKDQKSYYLKGKERGEKIFKSGKWVSGNKTMESITFSKNQLEVELRKYLKNLEERTGKIGIDDIKDELKTLDKENLNYSFNNPISKINIDEKDKTIADVSFVKVSDIIKEIDRWKIYYVFIEGSIELEYINDNIDLEIEYEVDGEERNFILEIPIDKSRGN